MRILIVSAMDIEEECLKNELLKAGYQGKGPCYTKGKLEIHMHQVGIGKVNSAVNTTVGVLVTKPFVLVNQGCCAGIQDVQVGDTFIVDGAYQYDYNTTQLGFRSAELPFYSSKVREFTADIGDIPSGLKVGKMLTADRFCDRVPDLASELTGVIGVDMETAAIYHASIILDIRAVSIRSVSDIVGAEDQSADYHDNLTIACTNAARKTVEWVELNFGKIAFNT